MTENTKASIPMIVMLSIAESDALIALSHRTGTSTVQLAYQFIIDGIQRMQGKPIGGDA